MLAAVAVCALRVLAEPGGAPFPPNSRYSDVVLSHWPAAEFVRRSLAVHGQLPLWNPNVLGGQPFAADPLAGIWYPPNWLLLLLPLPFGFNALFLLHQVWGGWGALRWLRVEGRSTEAAVLGALVVAGLPKAFAHYGAGHFGLVQALAWTPWALLAARRAEHAWGAVRLGGVLALVFLADVRWSVYATALVVAYWSFDLRRPSLAPLRMLLNLALATLVFALVAAVLWLPLLEFVRLSSRIALTLAEADIFALGVRDLLGVVLPNFGGHHELLTYLGWTPLLLAVLGAAGGVRSRRSRFWVGVAVLAAWWSLGASAGLFAAAFRALPGVALLRVPSRAWFMVGLAVAALAAAGLDRLRASISERRIFEQRGGGTTTRHSDFTAETQSTQSSSPAHLERSPVETGKGLRELRVSAVTCLHKHALAAARLGSAGMAAGAGALALGVVSLGGQLSPSPIAWTGWPFVWLALMAGAATLVLIVGDTRTAAALTALLLLDYAVVDATLVETRSAPEAVRYGEALVEFVSGTGMPPARLYAPGFSVSPVAAARAGVPQLESASPLHLARAPEWIAAATGVPASGYTEVLPAVNGDPRSANASATPSASGLAYFNVRWVASAFELEAPGLQQVAVTGRQRVYENPAAPGWAFLLDGRGAVELVAWSPDRIVVRVVVDRDDMLVISQAAYPGWRARIDGEGARFAAPRAMALGEVPTVGMLDERMAVRVPAGEHTVEVVFRPISVFVGMGLLLTGLALLAATGLRHVRRA